MPIDYKKTKKGTGSVFPERVYDAQAGLERVEAILTPSQLKSRFLFGVPLYSPMTKEKLSDADLQDYIKRGANQLEFDAKVEVSPVARRHRLPFDPNLYQQYIYLEIPNKPISRVVRVAICGASYRETPEAQEQAGIYKLSIGGTIGSDNVISLKINGLSISVAYVMGQSQTIQALADAIFENPYVDEVSILGDSLTITGKETTELRFNDLLIAGTSAPSMSQTQQQAPKTAAQYLSGIEIYRMPPEWIDMSYAVRGTLNINPINPAFSSIIGTPVTSYNAGATVLQFIGQISWTPAYWTVECIHGFCSENGMVPVIINEAIGQAAAIKALDNLIPLFKTTSQSLSIDGLGQSTSNSLAQLFINKRKDLKDAYDANVKKIKNLVGNNLFSSNV